MKKVREAVEIEQVRKVGGKDEKEREAVVVKLGCREQKKVSWRGREN